MMLNVEKLSKSYGPQKALDEVSFSVSSPQVVGLLGPNGAGKSTLMKLICGYLVPDAGRVDCLLYASPSPRDAHESRMPSSA